MKTNLIQECSWIELRFLLNDHKTWGIEREERRESELWGMFFNSATWSLLLGHKRDSCAFHSCLKKQLLLPVVMETNCLIGAVITADGGQWVTVPDPPIPHPPASLMSSLCFTWRSSANLDTEKQDFTVDQHLMHYIKMRTKFPSVCFWLQVWTHFTENLNEAELQ